MISEDLDPALDLDEVMECDAVEDNSFPEEERSTSSAEIPDIDLEDPETEELEKVAPKCELCTLPLDPPMARCNECSNLLHRGCLEVHEGKIFTDDQWDALLFDFTWRCFYCAEQLKFNQKRASASTAVTEQPPKKKHKKKRKSTTQKK